MELLRALKPSFMEAIYNDWIDNFQTKTIEDFMNHIKQEYSSKLVENCEPGQTGIYIDDEVKYRLNSLVRASRSKADWDYASSRIIFEGTGQGMGIFRLNDKGERLHLTQIQSTDYRIWNYLSLFVLNEYTIKRWGVSDNTERLMLFNSYSNQKFSRHSILRLYWTAFLCNDVSRSDNLELLKTLWKSQDFMTQITERSNTSNMREQLRWFLSFCSDPVNENRLHEKSSGPQTNNYHKMLILGTADNTVMALQNTPKNELELLFKENLASC